MANTQASVSQAEEVMARVNGALTTTKEAVKHRLHRQDEVVKAAHDFAHSQAEDLVRMLQQARISKVESMLFGYFRLNFQDFPM